MRNTQKLTIAGLLLAAAIATACRSAQYFPGVDPAPPAAYSRELAALRERPLTDDTPCPQCERYRFLWLRSANRSAVFRAELNQAGQGALIVTLGQLGPRESAARGIKTYRRTLVPAEVAQLRAAVQESSFWTLQPVPDEGRTDGARWIFEAQTKDGYHLVDRWSPEPGSYRQMCVLLIRLSGLDLDPVY